MQPNDENACQSNTYQVSHTGPTTLKFSRLPPAPTGDGWACWFHSCNYSWSNSWQSWLTDWNWMPWVLPLLGPFIFIILLLTFGPCLFNLSTDSSKTESEPFPETKSRLFFCLRPRWLEQKINTTSPRLPSSQTTNPWPSFTSMKKPWILMMPTSLSLFYINIYNCHIFLLGWSLDHYIMSFLISLYFFFNFILFLNFTKLY